MGRLFAIQRANFCNVSSASTLKSKRLQVVHRKWSTDFIFLFVCLCDWTSSWNIKTFLVFDPLVTVNYTNSNFLIFKTVKCFTIQKTLSSKYRLNELQGTFITTTHPKKWNEACPVLCPVLMATFLSFSKDCCLLWSLFPFPYSFITQMCILERCSLDMPDLVLF